MTQNDLTAPGSSERTRVRRIPEKAVTDRAVLHAVLDAGLVAHVAVVDDDGQPYVVPVAYARDGDRVLFHGSTGSRLFRALAPGRRHLPHRHAARRSRAGALAVRVAR